MDFVPKSIAELASDHAILFSFSLHYLVYRASDRDYNEGLIVYYLPNSHQKANHSNTSRSTISPFLVFCPDPSIRAARIWVGRARFGSRETR